MTPLTEPSRRETLVAIEAVERALGLASHGVGATDITAKDGLDLVTTTDLAIEDAVRSMIRDELDSIVIGEERGGDPPGGAPYWLVDPICGTRNFASGMTLYCVNLALVEDDQVTVAVVGDPSTGDVQFDERGRGAWAVQNGVRRALTTDGASRIVDINDGKAKGARRQSAAAYMAAAIRADRWNFRSLATTLGLSYVAAGRIAAYVVFYVPPLHAAAGSLLVVEAGGTMSDIDGRPWSLHSDSAVATARLDLEQEVLDLARQSSLGGR